MDDISAVPIWDQYVSRRQPEMVTSGRPAAMITLVNNMSGAARRSAALSQGVRYGRESP